jgi:DNA-binding Xre family transcriptional regulator
MVSAGYHILIATVRRKRSKARAVRSPSTAHRAVAWGGLIEMAKGDNMSGKMAKIKLRVKELAKAAGYTTAYQLQVAADISSSKAARLWGGKMDRIGIETIERLCSTLNCSPNDIFARADKKDW